MDSNGFWESEEVMSEEEVAASVQDDTQEEDSQSDGTFPEQEQEFVPEDPEEDDPESVRKMMSDARLRLEQGRLYEMLLEHSLFGEIQANPLAIQNVEKEIKRFIRERLEVLLGLKQDPRLAQQNFNNSSQFTPLEVDLLKKMIAKATNGVTTQVFAPPPAPKPVSGAIKPLGQQIKPIAPAPIQAQPSKSSVRVTPSKSQPPATKAMKVKTETGDIVIIPAEDEKPLSKIPAKMKRSEIMERNKRIAERQAARKALGNSPDRIPTPSPEQAAAMVASAVMNRAINPDVKIGGIPLGLVVSKAVQEQVSKGVTEED